jgi:hypothetical protein
MRGNTPPTMSSPPHRSRPTGNPPNRQPATVGEEERSGRDPTSRRTLMRAAPDCRQPPTVRHASQPSSSTGHPPQQQDTVHRELRPCTGKGAIAGAGQLRCATRPAAGRARAPPPPTPAPHMQPHTTRPPPTTTGRRKGEYPVLSNLPLHCARALNRDMSVSQTSWHKEVILGRNSVFRVFLL